MNKISIRREDDQIIVERIYKVVPNNSVYFDQRPNIDFFVIKNYVMKALETRMKHCLQQLDTEILPAEDKIFNEAGAIFSPSKGLYFNQSSYESMESAFRKIEETLQSEIFRFLTTEELDQVTKALIAFGEKLPEKEANYLAGLTMEALIVSLKEPKTVLRTEPK